MKKLSAQSKIPKESAEQIEIIRWWEQDVCKGYRYWPCALMHIPNGGSRNIVEARNLKLQGVRSGVPDLLLAIPNAIFHALWIELKRIKGGVIKPEQKEYIAWLRSKGFAAFVCKGSLEAKHLIFRYLSDPSSLLTNDNLIYKEAQYGTNEELRTA